MDELDTQQFAVIDFALRGVLNPGQVITFNMKIDRKGTTRSEPFILPVDWTET